MRDKLSNAVETVDDYGRNIYLAQVAGWNRLVDLVGVKPSLASAIDLATIIVGIAMAVFLSELMQIAGVLLVVVGVLGILRRYLA